MTDKKVMAIFTWIKEHGFKNINEKGKAIILEALEIQIPKSPTIKGINDYGEPRKLCPVCHCEFDDDNNYCGVCGQRLEGEPQFGCKDGVCEIDWGEEK